VGVRILSLHPAMSASATINNGSARVFVNMGPPIVEGLAVPPLARAVAGIVGRTKLAGGDFVDLDESRWPARTGDFGAGTAATTDPRVGEVGEETDRSAAGRVSSGGPLFLIVLSWAVPCEGPGSATYLACPTAYHLCFMGSEAV
jgi:hypothetical protein